MELDPAKIEAMLEMLRGLGVEEFECEKFKVRFSATAGSITETTTVTTVSDAIPTPKSLFENPMLYPGGKVPTFPRSDK